jgi:hypothetical protein
MTAPPLFTGRNFQSLGRYTRAFKLCHNAETELKSEHSFSNASGHTGSHRKMSRDEKSPLTENLLGYRDQLRNQVSSCSGLSECEIISVPGHRGREILGGPKNVWPQKSRKRVRKNFQCWRRIVVLDGSFHTRKYGYCPIVSFCTICHWR